MIIKKSAIVGVLMAFLAACSSDAGPKETAGTLLGAAAGGLIGAQFGSGSGQLAATAFGTLVGAWVGNEVGRRLDEEDRRLANQAYDEAKTAPVGETISWSNPDNGHSGTVTPVREGTTDSGQYCREFRTTAEVGDEIEEVYGTACRQPDGSWKIVQT